MNVSVQINSLADTELSV